VESLYRAYRDKVQFFLVYTREIHPSGGKNDRNDRNQSSSGKRPSRRKGPAIPQHRSMEERLIAADKCMKDLHLTIPTLLDTMDNSFARAFSGVPAGTTVIDIDGKIAYWNRGSPRGCKPGEAEKIIKMLLAMNGKFLVKEGRKPGDGDEIIQSNTIMASIRKP